MQDIEKNETIVKSIRKEKRGMIVMQAFTFKSPIYKGSTKILDVFDDIEEKTGSVQRVYRNKLQQTSDFILGNNFIINIKAFDIGNELACEINEVLGRKTLIKSQWKGYSNNKGNFTLFDKTKISTNPRWEIQTSDGYYKIEKNLGNKQVFMSDETGMKVAEITYDKPIPSQKNTMILHTKKWNSLEVAALYLLISTRY